MTLKEALDKWIIAVFLNIRFVSRMISTLSWGLILAVLLGATISEAGFSYTRCDKNVQQSESRVKLHNITVVPWPPVIGGALKVVLFADFLEKIDAGSQAKVDVSIDKVHIFDKTVDTCTALPSFKCPRGPENNARIEYDGKLPQIPFDGKFTVKVDAMDQAHAEILCIQFDVELHADDDSMMSNYYGAPFWGKIAELPHPHLVAL